jgi:probable phosphomutase (TIGR03848 family)
MTTYLLIRHGENDYIGNTLVGWMPGVHINEKGREQACRLAERLARVGIDAILSSPLERTRETAEPIAARLGLEVEIREEIGELHLGEWTGRPLAELRQDPLWKLFNRYRGIGRIPGGETMLEVQSRMLDVVLELRGRYRDGTVALVTHADPIRAILCYFMGIPLDMISRIEAGTASVSVATLAEWGPRVLRMNDTGELP